MAEPEKKSNEPKQKIETPWTEGGHRVVVLRFPGLLVLNCKTRTANFTDDKTSEWSLCDIGFPDGTRRPEAERFTAHAFSFFGDEQLTKDAVDAVRKVYTALPESADKAPQRQVPPDAN